MNNQLQTNANGSLVDPTLHDQPTSHLTNVESSRATQEVQASMVVAQKFPRNERTAFSRIMTSCQRAKLAEAAIYSYPRGGQQVRGPSIHLAKSIARAWGNLTFGIRELEQKNGESVVETFCWDLETNVRETKVFTVLHERHTRKGVQTLKDPRDIYELVANMGARRMRSCILGIIPSEVVEAAVDKCYETLKGGGGDKPLVDRVRDMITWFIGAGVSESVIEKRLKHNIAAIDERELLDLRMIANSIKDGASKREDYFDIGGSESGLAKSLTDDFKTPSEKPKEKPAPKQQQASSPDPEPASKKKVTPKEEPKEKPMSILNKRVMEI